MSECGGFGQVRQGNHRTDFFVQGVLVCCQNVQLYLVYFVYFDTCTKKGRVEAHTGQGDAHSDSAPVGAGRQLRGPRIPSQQLRRVPSYPGQHSGIPGDSALDDSCPTLDK